MAIKFLCPNGHQLSCKDERAGKPGTCPKCGTRFIVPDAEEIAAAASNGAATIEAPVPAGVLAAAGSGKGSGNLAGPSPSDKSTAMTPGSGLSKRAADPADMIVFLCPNGHRLNGPKSLQGKPGQCPHCNEKFRIPVYDEEPEEEPTLEYPTFEPEEEIPVGTAVATDPNAESEAVETFPEEQEIAVALEEGGLSTPSGEAIAPLPPGASHQLFDVFSRLWALKPAGTTVELLLADGKTVAPIKFSPALSWQACGVFVTQNEDGSLGIVAVPWSAVTRIDFQRIQELPPGVFQ